MGEAATKWTPGPWVVEVRDGRIYGIVAERVIGVPDKDNDAPDLGVIVETDGGYYPPRLHDACLIAAAPDLYTALAECLCVMEHAVTQSPRALKAARAALAKANAGTVQELAERWSDVMAELADPATPEDWKDG